jgi:hypothetical protein
MRSGRKGEATAVDRVPVGLGRPNAEAGTAGILTSMSLGSDSGTAESAAWA